MSDEPVDAAVQRLRDRETSARILERESAMREWLLEQFVKPAADKNEGEESERR